ncbi:hypothetical protein HOLleu_11055 [Holothuria leucospilota]|uniref:Uncharacterized protein n=1 Tax=Holothuria leucospilota TaxID=206669 RepID=A0A9Q1CET1_HOLLE|nr:hypothetical protein HOLleu_11055 [Holothuria leucospilota]
MSSIPDHPRATTAFSTSPFINHRPLTVFAAAPQRTGGKPTNPLKAILAGKQVLQRGLRCKLAVHHSMCSLAYIPSKDQSCSILSNVTSQSNRPMTRMSVLLHCCCYPTFCLGQNEEGKEWAVLKEGG